MISGGIGDDTFYVESDFASDVIFRPSGGKGDTCSSPRLDLLRWCGGLGDRGPDAPLTASTTSDRPHRQRVRQPDRRHSGPPRARRRGGADTLYGRARQRSIRRRQCRRPGVIEAAARATTSCSRRSTTRWPRARRSRSCAPTDGTTGDRPHRQRVRQPCASATTAQRCGNDARRRRRRRQVAGGTGNDYYYRRQCRRPGDRGGRRGLRHVFASVDYTLAAGQEIEIAASAERDTAGAIDSPATSSPTSSSAMQTLGGNDARRRRGRRPARSAAPATTLLRRRQCRRPGDRGGGPGLRHRLRQASATR